MGIIKGELPFLEDDRHVISIVGAGGKTTLMYALAECCARKGKKVLVTTTTHIFRPENSLWVEDIQGAEKLWESNLYAVVGRPAEDNKLRGLPEKELKMYIEMADVVLIEADGARRKPCKVPAFHEPVIPDESDIVIGVMGMDALNQPLEEVCFRMEEAVKFLHVATSDKLNINMMAEILASDKGTRKNVGGREYYVVLNKCDTKERVQAGEQIIRMLNKRGIHRCVLTGFSEGGMT
jgi:probable selenium-dependent hydroxylase accessory protein YqeC